MLLNLLLIWGISMALTILIMVMKIPIITQVEVYLNTEDMFDGMYVYDMEAVG